MRQTKLFASPTLSIHHSQDCEFRLSFDRDGSLSEYRMKVAFPERFRRFWNSLMVSEDDPEYKPKAKYSEKSDKVREYIRYARRDGDYKFTFTRKWRLNQGARFSESQTQVFTLSRELARDLAEGFVEFLEENSFDRS